MKECGFYWVRHGMRNKWGVAQIQRGRIFIAGRPGVFLSHEVCEIGPRLPPPDSTGRVTAEDWAALDAVQARLDESERLRERLERKYGIPPDNDTGEIDE